MAEQLDMVTAGIEAFGRMDESIVRTTLQRYVANLVVTRLLHVLSAELEGGAITAMRAVAVEFEIRDFVESAVAFNLGNVSLSDMDWSSPQAVALADRLVREGYEIFGGNP